jgi:NAD(P)H dehydrogenase (quinone)
MPKIVIIYHSGFGHTAVVAEAVAAGARAAGADATLHRISGAGDDFAPLLAAVSGADAVVFGAPTYMGDISTPLKAFFEASVKIWAQQGWKDKLAAGFTNSGSYGGDKANALSTMLTFAMQHAMVWAGVGVMSTHAAPSAASGAESLNQLGFYTGLATQSDNASPDVTPPPGDRETARLFGARIALLAARFTPAP